MCQQTQACSHTQTHSLLKNVFIRKEWKPVCPGTKTGFIISNSQSQMEKNSSLNCEHLPVRAGQTIMAHEKIFVERQKNSTSKAHVRHAQTHARLLWPAVSCFCRQSRRSRWSWAGWLLRPSDSVAWRTWQSPGFHNHRTDPPVYTINMRQIIQPNQLKNDTIH